MLRHLPRLAAASFRRVLANLGSDQTGNTFMILAAALAPMLALVGGAIDMGRGYLSQTRLQQACDAGVLAARKNIGASGAGDGALSDSARAVGMRFFNLNFRQGVYGSGQRDFAMTLGEDFTVNGVASVDVPTAIMRIFGENHIPIKVKCAAKLNFSNTDVMMVLDTTGSMNQTNAGDSSPKIAILRQVVKDFWVELDRAKPPATRIRYGFVPYSTNVNVGGLLNTDWLVDKWSYEGRKAKIKNKTITVVKYDYTNTYVSGSQMTMTSIPLPDCPESTARWTQSNVVTHADGSQSGRTTVTGTTYTCNYSDGGYFVGGTQYNSYVYDWTKTPNGTEEEMIYTWEYKSVDVDVRALKMGATTIPVPMNGNPAPLPDPLYAKYKGCIEERDTYEFSGSDPDLSKALDLDLDLVPGKDKKTQWRPMLHQISFLRAIKASGGSWSKKASDYSGSYIRADDYGFSACPSAARKLAEMTESEIGAYVDGLRVEGSTYHDIGMIWGGRLLSPTGLFADENADVGSTPTRRHLIFLTDGETAPLDLSYGAYGVEPLSQRRWSPSSPFTLTKAVEDRFLVACNEVKKRNITVWVVSFGVAMSPMLKACADNTHRFEAANADELSEAFRKIARTMGDLRISK
jgi:hypothetical protein